MTQKVLWRIFKTYFPIKGITKAKREFTISLNDLGIFEFKPKNHDTKPKNRKAPQGGSLADSTASHQPLRSIPSGLPGE